MLPLVLLVPLALVSLEIAVPWPLAAPLSLVPSSWAPEAAASRRLEAPAEGSLEERLEKLLRSTNTNESGGRVPSFEHDQLYSSSPYDDPYGPYNGGGGGTEDAVIATLTASLVIIVVFGCLSCGVGLIFACQYKTKVVDRRPPLPGEAGQLAGGDFRSGPFSCFDDTPTCCHATFCGACRAGDTFQTAGLQQFWTVIGLFFLCSLVGNIVAKAVTSDPAQAQNLSSTISAVCMGGIFHGYRRQLRTRLGGNENAQPIWMDFLLYSCCLCCAIAQEARELDAAMGVKVECCCNLQSVGGPAASEMRTNPGGMPQVTGQPVEVQPATQQALAGTPQVTGQPVG